jgi:hypothetical protein
MVHQAQLETPLRKVQDSSWASGVFSSALEGTEVSQAAGGYIAVDSFIIVKPESKDRSRDFTGSTNDIYFHLSKTNGELTIIETAVQKDTDRGANYFEMGYSERKWSGSRRIRYRL